MKRLMFALFAVLALICAGVANADVISGAGVNTELIPLMTNGPADERINIVFVPEFYGNRRKAFVDDVNLIKDALFEVEPFKSYRQYFNTSAIWMTFDRSPVQPMLYFCGYADENNYCRNYDNMYLSRGIVGRYYPVKNVVVVFLAYIGSSGFGDPFTGWPNGPICYTQVDMGQMHETFTSPEDEYFARVFSRRSLVHESGHAFGNLGDEYVNTAAPRRARGTELTEDGYTYPNLTFENRRDRIRWRRWIDPATPVPTPDTPANRNKVGLFESAMGITYGIYRPMSACMMNNPSADHSVADRDPFCSVCREVLTRSINRFSNTIEETGYAVGDTSTTFRASLISAGRGFEVKWLVDGRAVSLGSADSLRVGENSIGFGPHTIRIEVSDTTSFVRDDPQRLLVESYEWPVVNTPTSDFDRNGRVDVEDFFQFADAFGGNIARNPELGKFDLDLNGEIGFPDFFLFADAFSRR